MRDSKKETYSVPRFLSIIDWTYLQDAFELENIIGVFMLCIDDFSKDGISA